MKIKLLLTLALLLVCFTVEAENNGERFARVEKDFYDAKLTGEVTNRMQHYDFRKRYGKRIYEDVVFGVDRSGKCPFCGREKIQ